MATLWVRGESENGNGTNIRETLGQVRAAAKVDFVICIHSELNAAIIRGNAGAQGRELGIPLDRILHMKVLRRRLGPHEFPLAIGGGRGMS